MPYKSFIYALIECFCKYSRVLITQNFFLPLEVFLIVFFFNLKNTQVELIFIPLEIRVMGTRLY